MGNTDFKTWADTTNLLMLVSRTQDRDDNETDFYSQETAYDGQYHSGLGG